MLKISAVLPLLLLIQLTKAQIQQEGPENTQPDATANEVPASTSCVNARRRDGLCIERQLCDYGTSAIDFSLYSPKGFVSFPVSDDIRVRWIEATGRSNWTPKKSSRICSRHFEQNALLKKRKVTVLFPDAVPILEMKIIATPSTSPVVQESMETENKLIQSSSNIDFINEPDFPSTADVHNTSPRANFSVGELTTGKSPNYTPRTLRRKFKRTRIQSAERLKKLRALREKSKRLTKKVTNLETMIAELKAKSLVSEEEGDLLESIDPVNKDYLKKMLYPTTAGRKYSPALRKFALCLNFISPRAYKYVRQQFNTCLPHPPTLTTWYKSVDANAGFTTESLNCIQLLASKKQKPLYCAVSMDEMAIRRHVQWDGKKCVGLVNYGEALDGHSVAEAREALVFMVTCINDGWKMPVGYFFIDGCTGEQKANLVKQCVGLLFDCGVNIISLTFDGCPSNFAMAKILGCRCNPSGDITPVFSVGGRDIVIIPDPAHMLKLVRNALGQKKVLTNARGENITWQFIENLNTLQEKEGLHLANRLKSQHINFGKQIMKVKLAAQTFSNSVAEAIQFCNQNLNLPDFLGSDATVEFISKINNLFDIFNSRNLNAYGFKKPINEKNGNQILDYLTELESYIKGLQLEDRSLLESNRKVGFLGLLICIQSLNKIYADYILTGKLKFLPFYKLSQDHLECFFSSIRSKGGYNNNPTAFQFQSAYKRLVVHGEIKSISSGNCIPLEEIKILTHTEIRYESKINAYTNTGEHENPDLEESSDDLVIDSDHDYLADPSKLTVYTEEIIPYIGGFVVKKLRKTLKCEDCLLALVNTEKYSGLILKKDKGGLMYPSRDVVKICMSAEKTFRRNLLKGKSFFAEKKIMLQLMVSTLKQCQSVFTEDHFNRQPLIGNHRILLIKAIMAHYFELRIHHGTKSFEPKGKNWKYSHKTSAFQRAVRKFFTSKQSHV